MVVSGEVAERIRVRLSPVEVIERRSNRLARALLRLGIKPGSKLVAYLDDIDGMDGRVAVRAAEKLRLDQVLVVVPKHESDALDAAKYLALEQPDVILACERGLVSLMQANVRSLIIGDGEGVYWWRLIEARESSEDLQLDSVW